MPRLARLDIAGLLQHVIVYQNNAIPNGQYHTAPGPCRYSRPLLPLSAASDILLGELGAVTKNLYLRLFRYGSLCRSLHPKLLHFSDNGLLPKSRGTKYTIIAETQQVFA